MSVISFSIENIPDLSLNKYQSLADTGTDGLLKRHESFLRQWHGICKVAGLSFHLLYIYLPDALLGQRLKMYFLLNGADEDIAMARPLLEDSPLSDFFRLKQTPLPQNVSFGAAAAMIKKERVASIHNPLAGVPHSVYYVPKWEMNESGRLYDLLRIMGTVGQVYSPARPCAFRMDLYPVSNAEQTRERFTPILRELRGGNDIKLARDTDSIKSDDYAREICKEYEDWLTQIETSPHFRVNLYAFAANTFQAKVLLNAAGSEALTKGDMDILPLRPEGALGFQLLSRMGSEAHNYGRHIAQNPLADWPTTFLLSEAVPFFRFPVLYDGEVIELPKETAPVQTEDGIYLGVDTNGYPVHYALEDLPRHGFFTGMPGSGKTNTMLHLVTQLHSKRIPFLVMEPAKKEYRAILGYENMRDVHLFSPHLQSHFPLHMNPLEFPRGVRLSEHINALLEVFQGSFVLEGPTYKFLSNSIQRAYLDKGWDIDEVNGEWDQKEYPRLQDIYDKLKQEIDRSSYDAELKGNVQGFLEVRLGSLMERDAGELFNVAQSTIPPEEWLTSSAIIELEVLSEGAKNFFVLLVCHYILEALRADPMGGIGPDGTLLPVRHVLFIEEAHNIIAPNTEQAGSDSVDPKISATNYIVKMLAEVRALREAIVIADQLPTSLASQVTKNTGLKLVHRLTAQDDREIIGSAISATPMQLERMAAFRKGRAFIYHENTMKAFEMQVAEWKKPNTNRDLSNDRELYSLVWDREGRLRAIDISRENMVDLYLLPLSQRIKELFQEIMPLWEQKKFQQLAGKQLDRIDLVEELHRVQRKFLRMEDLWLDDCPVTHPYDDSFRAIQEELDTMLDNLKKIGELISFSIKRS